MLLGSVAPCCQTRKRSSFCFDYIGWNIAAQCNLSVRTPSEYSHLQSCSILQAHQNFVVIVIFSSGSRGAEGPCPPPGPVQISHEKDGGRIDFMFLGPPLTQPLDPLLILQIFIQKNYFLLNHCFNKMSWHSKGCST